ncbi:MAG: glycosyltransferase [Alteromonadaceae bacterium]|nr:MAG: glycosyltransferase [Alteromonadaceae bacterium]
MNREQQAADALSLSVVIPFYNEAGNIRPLIAEIIAALDAYSGSWEIVAVDDGSRDGSDEELDALVAEHAGHGEFLHVIHFTRNFGQTAAMQAGIEAAQGELIVTMDGDRQNDPADIPKMIQHLEENDLDMVSGWRKHRQDSRLRRRLPSRIANMLIRRVTGVTIQDYGCSLKLFRAVIIKQVVLMGEMHRFIPAWVASVTDPRRIGQLPVNHRARSLGDSKYGLSRTFRVIIDLFSVLFFMRFSRRPGHFFGSIGLASGGLGGLILTYLLFVKIIMGEDIGARPLLFTGILLVITGIQLLTTGVLAEIQIRASGSQSYPTRASRQPQKRAWYERSASK